MADDGAGGGDAGALRRLRVGGDLVEGEERLGRHLEGSAEERLDALGLGTAQLLEQLAVVEVAADGAQGDAELDGDIGRRQATGEQLEGALTAEAGSGAGGNSHGWGPSVWVHLQEHLFL